MSYHTLKRFTSHDWQSFLQAGAGAFFDVGRGAIESDPSEWFSHSDRNCVAANILHGERDRRSEVDEERGPDDGQVTIVGDDRDLDDSLVSHLPRKFLHAFKD